MAGSLLKPLLLHMVSSMTWRSRVPSRRWHLQQDQANSSCSQPSSSNRAISHPLVRKKVHLNEHHVRRSTAHSQVFTGTPTQKAPASSFLNGK